MTFFDLLTIPLLYSLSFVISIFPNANTANLSFLSSQLANFIAAVTPINWFFPVPTLLFVISLIISIEGSLLAYKTIKYLAHTFTAGFIKQ